VLEADDSVASAQTFGFAGVRPDEGEVRAFVDGAGAVDAVGHRVVHGGVELTEPAILDDRLVARLEALTDLAPLHQPKSLQAIELVSTLLPGTPSVACFDTAFHARIPAAAATYALPLEWRTRWPLRRFGFHGLSHAYVSRRAADLAGAPVGELRIVSCHLGAGASLAAVDRGVSVDTTMGFTPLEGLVMATRSGSVDPGLLTWLEEHVGMPPAELAAALDHRSGLRGLAGTEDMREILARESGGDERAVLAVSVYVHRLRGAIASMAAAMSGLDVVVFTGGVGERSAEIRARACDGLGFLGIVLDTLKNEQAPDAEIGAAEAPVRAFVVTSREDVEVARGVRSCLVDPVRKGSAR
jgi:acetate kinase